MIREARPKVIRPLMLRTHARLYWDSCGRPECLAGVLLLNGEGDFFSSHVSSAIAPLLDNDRVENRSTHLETLAPVLCLSTLGHLMQGCDVTAYGDNQAANAALGKGCSSSPWMCSLVAEFWCLAQDLDIFVWFEWVASDSNPADPLSRPLEKPGLQFGFDRGWMQLQTAFPLPRSFRFPPPGAK